MATVTATATDEAMATARVTVAARAMAITKKRAKKARKDIGIAIRNNPLDS